MLEQPRRLQRRQRQPQNAEAIAWQQRKSKQRLRSSRCNSSVANSSKSSLEANGHAHLAINESTSARCATITVDPFFTHMFAELRYDNSDESEVGEDLSRQASKSNATAQAQNDPLARRAYRSVGTSGSSTAILATVKSSQRTSKKDNVTRSAPFRSEMQQQQTQNSEASWLVQRRGSLDCVIAPASKGTTPSRLCPVFTSSPTT